MRNAILRKVLFLTALTAILAANADAGQTYGFEFSQGLHWRVQTAVRQTTTQTLMDISDEQFEHVTLEYLIFDYDFVVQEVTGDGSAWVRFTIDRVRLENERRGQYVTFDSQENFPVAAALEGFAALPGKSYELLITPSGRVSQVRGLEQLYSAVETALEDNPAVENIVNDIKVQFSRQNLLEQTEMMLAVFPDEPAQLGHQWSREFNLSGGVPIVVRQEFMLRGIRDQAALINSQATIEPYRPRQARRSGVSDVRFEMSGTQSGRSQVDMETGRIIESHREQLLEGKLYMSLPGTDQQMEVPIRIESDFTVKMEPAD